MIQYVSKEFPRSPKDLSGFRIFAALQHRTLGDFTDQLLFAASVSEMFQGARLDVYFRPDRPFKAEILSLAPQVSSIWPTLHGMPIDLFDIAGRRPIAGPDEWIKSGCDSPDLLLTPSMCKREKLGYFNPVARFRIPERDRWESELEKAAGSRCFCVLHYREEGYTYSLAGQIRNIEASDVEPVVDLLLARGVQVIRVGHPGMTPLRERQGYVDLSAAPLMLQACAISRARFFMEISPSGPYAIANGFGVPMARCNALITAGPATPESIVLMRPVLDPAGKAVTGSVPENYSNLEDFLVKHAGHTIGRNSIDQIEAAADELIDVTKYITGWRPQPDAGPPPSSRQQFTWPIPELLRHRVAF